MSQKMHWLKLHTEIIDDPKLADFTGDEFRMFVYLLAIARESSTPGTIQMGAQGIAWRTRQPLDLVEATLRKCAERGVVRLDVTRDVTPYENTSDRTSKRPLFRSVETVTLLNFLRRQEIKPSDLPEETRERKRKSRATSRQSHDQSRDRGEERRGDKRREEESRGEESTPLPPKGGRSNYPAEFLAFWDAYPRRDAGKHAAFRRWQKLTAEGTPPADLEAAARHYAKHMADVGREVEHQKHAATFLSAKDQHWREYVAGPPPVSPKPPGKRPVLNQAFRDLATSAGVDLAPKPPTQPALPTPEDS